MNAPPDQTPASPPEPAERVSPQADAQLPDDQLWRVGNQTPAMFMFGELLMAYEDAVLAHPASGDKLGDTRRAVMRAFGRLSHEHEQLQRESAAQAARCTALDAERVKLREAMMRVAVAVREACAKAEHFHPAEGQTYYEASDWGVDIKAIVNAELAK